MPGFVLAPHLEQTRLIVVVMGSIATDVVCVSAVVVTAGALVDDDTDVNGILVSWSSC